MMTQYLKNKCLLVTLLCGGWFSIQPISASPVSGTQSDSAAPQEKGATKTANDKAAVLHLNRLNGVFTVTSFEVVNGVGQASGFLTAEAFDTSGLPLNIFTNTAVKVPMPLNGPLTGRASLLADLSKDYVPPPMLSTNLCTILAISVAFVDVTVPGLGLNVHVNQLLVAIRADKQTRLGDVLCTVLGEDVGKPLAAASKLKIRLNGNQVVVEGQGPGTLQAAPALKTPSPWTDILGPPLQSISSNNPVQLILAPTGSVQFFRLAPQ